MEIIIIAALLVALPLIVVRRAGVVSRRERRHLEHLKEIVEHGKKGEDR